MKVSKIKSNFIFEDIRLNAGYFLNEDALNSMKLETNRNRCISLDQVANVWNPPIFKRQFCEKTERSIPYCQSSDVTNLLEGSDVYIYKEQALKVNSVVKENQILVTGFGTVGNTRLVNELSSGISYANNVCRIEASEKLPFGYIYSFLTSKYGRSQLNKNASGSVVRYIEAPGIKKTLIPVLSEEKQQQIHQLIVEASELRVEANRLLKEAQNKITSKLDFEKSTIYQKTSITDIITSHQKRFESQYHKSIGSNYRDRILNSNHILLKDASEDIFRPGIFKRNYVKQGVDFLGGSDITKSIPDSDKKLSKRNTPNFDELTLKEDWILVTCGGTIGTSVLVNSYLATKLASQHILRVIPKGIKTGYLFAFLSSDIGVKVIQSFTYGSVIPQIEPHHLELVPIPLLNDEIMNQIDSDVMRYKFNINEAILKENQAIALIEKEIDLWQVS